MNWLDIVLAIAIALSMWAGFSNGFLREGIGFAAAICGIVCGFWFYGVAAGYILHVISSRAVANVLGFFLILGGVLLVGAIVAKLMARFFKWVGLGWLDRIMGAAFGFVRGVVLTAALMAVIIAFSPSPPPAGIVNSRMMPYAIGISSFFASVAPHEVREGFQDGLNKLEKIWSEGLKLKKKNKKLKEDEV